jgi:hypothetical protein
VNFKNLSLSYSRSYKKVSKLLGCRSDAFTGLLLSDKTGEIGFINLASIGKIPLTEEVKESVEYED